jgi:hypothetical protein
MNNYVWILLTIERRTNLIAGAYIGKRNDAGSGYLWISLSEYCQKNGIFFTDSLNCHGQSENAGLSTKEMERKHYILIKQYLLKVNIRSNRIYKCYIGYF